MYRTREYAGVTIEIFAGDVVEALEGYGLLAEEDEATAKDRLIRILDFEPLRIQAKAVLLRLEHERRFCSSRIMTDARPVFGDDPEAPPVGMLITHTLKITFHSDEGAEHKEVYVTLRSKDLDELREAVTRAESKEKSLREALIPTKIPLFDSMGRTIAEERQGE